MTDVDVFALFRTAFPESFIIEILIPQTNINIKGEELTLSEFYVWLGVNFLLVSAMELLTAKIGGQWIQFWTSKVLCIK